MEMRLILCMIWSLLAVICRIVLGPLRNKQTDCNLIIIAAIQIVEKVVRVRHGEICRLASINALKRLGKRGKDNPLNTRAAKLRIPWEKQVK